MKYVIYNKETMVIKTISLEEPAELLDNEGMAQSDSLELGDEVSNQITIQKIENGVATAYSAYKIAPNVSELLRDSYAKDEKIEDLTQTIADLTELVLMGGM